VHAAGEQNRFQRAGRAAQSVLFHEKRQLAGVEDHRRQPHGGNGPPN